MILDDFSLKGKKALVTGSATGIGQAIAIGLAEAGAEIFGVYHNSAPENTKNAVEAVGASFHSLRSSLNSVEECRRVVDEAAKTMGQVDLLINCAGCVHRGTASDMTEEAWDLTLDLNLKTTYFMCQSFALQCFDKGIPGKIINTASMLSFFGGEDAPAYAASKHGVAGLTKALASDWAASGINVNAIAPGWIFTKMTQAVRDLDVPQNNRIIQRTPVHKWGSPDDFKGVAVWLCSNAADFIHGAIIPVDGGYMTR